MTPADLLAIWDSLAAQPASSSGTERRRLMPAAEVDMFACVLWPNRARGILIEGTGNHQPLSGRLPKCKGVRVLHEVFEAGGTERTVLRVTLEDGRLGEIFAVLAADLVTAIGHESTVAAGLRQCLDRLTMWQGLLERAPLAGLTPEQQRGLFGELTVLHTVHLAATDSLTAVLSWQGQDSAHQDFNTAGVGIEVKTTLAKRHARLMIANEKQLDERPLNELFLAHVRLDESAAGITLPQLVENVRATLASDPLATREFELRLMQGDYLGVHEPLYTADQYTVSSIRLFHVKENFPRLTETRLPPGVGDIRYSIIADDLSTYEVTTQFVSELLGRKHG